MPTNQPPTPRDAATLVITTEADWFIDNMLPPMVAAFFPILCKAISIEVESMEPFYQMSLASGASERRPVFIGYNG
jgi:hypothetical protein